MKIHHSSPSGDFTIVPNETLRDERLSFAARGHLAYLLSRPDDWRTNADAEAERARKHRSKRGEGRVSMRAVYKELKDAGYIVLVRSAGKGGAWTTEAHVYDRPFSEFPQVAPTYSSPNVGEPTYSSPGVGSPAVGGTDRRLTRTSSTKTVHEDCSPVKTSTQSQDQETGGLPPDPRDQPKTGAGRVVDSTSQSLVAGAEGDGSSNPSQPAPVKEGSVRKSQTRRLPNGSDQVADDAQGFSPNDADSTTTGTTRARPRHADKPAA